MHQFELQIGGVLPEDLSRLVRSHSSEGAKYMMQWHAFAVLPEVTQTVTLIQIGLDELLGEEARDSTRPRIYDEAAQRGWGTCLPIVGPLCTLAKDALQLGQGKSAFIGMDPIGAFVGYPLIFSVGRGVEGLLLGGNWSGTASAYDPRSQFVFQQDVPSRRE